MAEKRSFPVHSRAIRCGLVAIGLAVAFSACDDVTQPHGAARQIDVTEEAGRLLKEFEPFEFDFDLKDVSGQNVSKADFAGKVLIVDIWGTWCPPCRMEIPFFLELKRQYGPKGLEIVGLNDEGTDDDDRASAARLVRSYCRTQGIDYPCAIITQPIKEQVPRYGSFPTTLFIDHTGKVRLKLMGLHDLPFLQAIVEALLKELPPAADASADAVQKLSEDEEKSAE
jgi:thiol-disulfide isomerase/thioredoxin